MGKFAHRVEITDIYSYHFSAKFREIKVCIIFSHFFRFNLFGDNGAAWSVIYVDIDAHNRNRDIFESLLPRESTSKDVDVALLSAISFPAFATHEEKLYTQTKSKIEKVQ